MKLIKLTQGQVCLVDDEDYEFYNQWKWQAIKSRDTYYARRSTGYKPRKTLMMHRCILGLINPKIQVDHKDFNGLNNQKSNIRTCTHAQNHMHHKKQKGCTSSYKGVSWYKKTNKWVAHIRINKELKHLGYFDIEEEAALSYDRAALVHFGEYACINFTIS